MTTPDDIERMGAAAVERLRAAPDLDALTAVLAEVTGKGSDLGAVKRGMGQLDAEARKQLGQTLNRVNGDVGRAAAERRAELEAAARRVRLEAERLDLTEVRPTTGAGHLHLVTQTMEELEDVFTGLGFAVAEGPEVEDDWHNFTGLNIPAYHPARDMQDTFFVDRGEPGDVVLRTHTSPVQLRVMEQQGPPIYIVVPGRVHRNEARDATHLATFHQLEALVVDEGITFGHLAGTIEAFTAAYFGEGFTSRLRPSYFPFTEPSAEFDIRRPDGTWLELGGCGMVHPNVLRNGGIDPERYTGFAFGFGIDRLALARHGVPDLREILSVDVRFLEQF
ncbi:phenylalanine--tRNA ligase subunit alpha [Iamia sp. SCSIO 61187]|uniref:phenylalanine--tRNA ligase subunit alpha n=1 Tax=Iamia sp. SCSIO 61187 TaxID=2722752 RepID=UPI001C63954F|nr:phenylalanine--tRNA ligase subunit alpha [Iamia sp. SCSIO 61187]QYG93056.1 phenylalanine--tRNA ligase subunit alpha [Iamia sp. SCSIO 61187]